MNEPIRWLDTRPGYTLMNTLVCHLIRLLVITLSVVGLRGEASRTLCRGPDGKIVDWWILYKQSGSLRYVYLSSEDANKGERFSQPLHRDLLIDDVDTSPFLRTVYDSRPAKSDVKEDDNRVLLAWNDQQPHQPNSRPAKKGKSNMLLNDEQKTAAKHYKKIADVDQNLEETKLGEGKDMYGRGGTEDFAHSKGILGLSVRPDEAGGRANTGTAEFYLITHSFPRTPNGDHVDEEDMPIKRQFITDDPKQFFGRNISIPTSKAQHALCISMRQKVQLDNGKIVFDRKRLDLQKQNLFALLNGLDVIGPSLTLTNYVPWMPHFKVYHQLFDIRTTWSEDPIKRTDKVFNKNVARVISRNPQQYRVMDTAKHAYPLWPSHSRVRVDANGNIVEGSLSAGKHKASSLRSPGQVYATRCRVWDARQGQHRDPGCFASALLTSTGKDPLVIQFIAKNGLVIADTDDIISSRLLPKQDLELAGSEQRSPKKYASLLVVHQSWYDHATFGSHAVDFVKTDRLHARAYFHNNLGVRLPEQDGDTIRYVAQPSNGQDHSKWFVSHLYGQTGSYKPIAGVSDLNRNRKATILASQKHGRGGFFFITSNPGFVRFFMSLDSIIEDNANFANVPIAYFTADYHDEEGGVPLAKVLEINTNGDAIKMQLQAGKRVETFVTPYCEVPRAVELLIKESIQCPSGALLSTPKSKKRLKEFLTGSPAFSLKRTPPRMRQYPQQRTKQYGKGLPLSPTFGPSRLDFDTNDFDTSDFDSFSGTESSSKDSFSSPESDQLFAPSSPLSLSHAVWRDTNLGQKASMRSPSKQRRKLVLRDYASPVKKRPEGAAKKHNDIFGDEGSDDSWN